MNAWLAAGLGVVVAIDLALLWILVGPAMVRRPGDRDTGWRDGIARGALDLRAIAALEPIAGPGDGVPVSTYDRVVRVAGWACLLSTATLVYATGLWRDTQDSVLLILAIGSLFLLVAHDILAAVPLGRTRFAVEGAVAITLLSLVVTLTGGASSPFFYAFPIVVAGTALVVRPRSATLLAVVAIAGYLAAVVAAAGGAALDVHEATAVAVNLTALVVLTYVALVVAHEQRRTRDAVLRLSTIDALTGLANRGYILASMEREIERATRYQRGFCVLMADLDHLKLINDTFGHRTGDRALAAVADVLRENVRRIDTVARLGGDEFVALLPETDREGALVVAEKIRQAAAEFELLDRGEKIPIGISIGIGEWHLGRTLDDVMSAADEAMYVNKRRDRVRPDGRPPMTPVGPGRQQVGVVAGRTGDRRP